MSEKLDSFQFDRRGRKSIYPWDTWLDGKIHKLAQGEDFKTPIQNFRSAVYGAARKRGKALRTTITPDGYLVIQAIESKKKS